LLSATFASSLARAEGRCRHRPLVAAANRRDRAHGIVAALVTELGRELVIPGPVLVEVDQLLRARVGAGPARLFLDAIAAGEHPVAFLSAGLMRRAIEIDARFADLDLGLVDGCVMAIERVEPGALWFEGGIGPVRVSRKRPC
jgi:predicted nucleic acid-binding protein